MRGFFKEFNAKTATILGIVVIAILIVGVGAVYGLGLHKSAPEASNTASAEQTPEPTQETQQAVRPTEATKESTEKKETKSIKETKDTKAVTSEKKKTSKATQGKSDSKNNGKAAEKKEKGLYCKLTINCKTAAGNSDLKDSKKGVVPSGGVLLSTAKAEFKKGDSVYDVLRRETKARGIHMESAQSPGYNTQYIKGIGNLYEFDCGELSGWMYKVNGVFPNYGCSQYKLKAGDAIELIYTCDLGEDIGGRNY